jgi:hypothetical protein
MSVLSVRLPNSLHAMVKNVAAEDAISINQFIASAVAEKLSAMTTEKYIAERAAKASKEKFKAVLAKVPSVAASGQDAI